MSDKLMNLIISTVGLAIAVRDFALALAAFLEEWLN